MGRASDPALQALLGAFHDVPTEAPADLEDTHWTSQGATTYPPGAISDSAARITALLNEGGRDLLAQGLWSAGSAATVVGDVGTATATSSTSLTGSGGATHASNDSVGMVIVAFANGGYGIVGANTSGATPVFTIDRWYSPASPGGSPASTPSGTTGYMLVPGGVAMLFMGISANSAVPTVGDNYPGASWNLSSAMTGEISTSGGGLVPKVCVMAHTAGTNSLTATAVFTANSSDSLPVTIAKMGIGPSIVAGNRRGLQTLLSATATLNVSGDQLTVTDTITTS